MSINLQPDLFNQNLVEEKEFEDFRPIDLKSSGTNGTSNYKTWYELDESRDFILKIFEAKGE